MKIVNKIQLIEEAKEGIEILKAKKNIYNIVLEELSKLDGKKITKRFATLIEKRLNDTLEGKYYVSYTKDQFLKDRFSLLPYKSSNSEDKQLYYNNMNEIYIQAKDGIYNHKSLVSNAKWLTNWNERIEEYKHDMQMLEESNIIEEYNKAVYTILQTHKQFKSTLHYKLDK